MIFRLLFLMAVVYIGWRVARVVLAKIRSSSPPAEKPYLPMAQCAKCGAHVSQDTLTQKGLCGRCVESTHD